MIPKLLVSSNQTTAQQYIDVYINKFAISSFDTLTLGENGNAIKIEQIRDLKQTLSLKPLNGTKKATIIYAAQNLTSEAQNALLKTLEEPPEDTVIFLCTPNENLLLPTIMSRCEIVRLQNQNANLPPRGSPRVEAGKIQNYTFQQILIFDMGEKFALAEKLTTKIDKDEKLEDVRKRVEKWIMKIIAELHHTLSTNMAPQSAINLKIFLAAQKQIRQNLNLRLVLENCLMNLIK